MRLDLTKTSQLIVLSLLVIFLFAMKIPSKNLMFALIKCKLYAITWWFAAGILYLLCFGTRVTEQIIP